MSNGDKYDSDYYLRGRETGKSLYQDYRWMPQLTVPMVQAIADHCGIVKGNSVLDFGCARGYIVKALRGLGYDAWGADISRWAVENADPEVRDFCRIMSSDLLGKSVADWVVAKDVLEHIEYVSGTVRSLMDAARVGVFAVVPLSAFNGSKYVVREYEEDATHVQRLTLVGWLEMFLRPGWRVEAAYRLPGVKDNYFRPGWELGNGFITARRISE